MLWFFHNIFQSLEVFFLRRRISSNLLSSGTRQVAKIARQPKANYYLNNVHHQSFSWMSECGKIRFTFSFYRGWKLSSQTNFDVLLKSVQSTFLKASKFWLRDFSRSPRRYCFQAGTVFHWAIGFLNQYNKVKLVRCTVRCSMHAGSTWNAIDFSKSTFSDEN